MIVYLAELQSVILYVADAVAQMVEESVKYVVDEIYDALVTSEVV